MRKELLVKTLAMGVVVLFISVSFQPTLAEESVLNEKESNYENVDFEEAKKYLFETIVEIGNNLEFKNLFKQCNNELFTSDYDYYKSAFSQILFKKPRLLSSILFTKPKMTYEYLETSYNGGMELVEIIGKEESLKIVESVDTATPGFFDDLKNIIMDNTVLSNRITILKKMNQELKSDLNLWHFPIICTVLILLFYTFTMIFKFVYNLCVLFKNFPIINELLSSLGNGLLYILYYISMSDLILECWWD